MIGKGDFIGEHDYISIGNAPFRWTEETGTQIIAPSAAGNLGATAHAISSDGNTVVGNHPSSPISGPYRWTEDDGNQPLDPDREAPNITLPWGLSGDGSTAVGGSYGISDLTGIQPFRWTEDDGYEDLGLLEGVENEGSAYDASYDGSIIVGRMGYYPTPEAQVFVWTEEDGMRSLFDILTTDGGLDLEGWSLFNVAGISDDGTVIAGTGLNPDGHYQGWIAIIPEPASASLLGLGLLALRRRS